MPATEQFTQVFAGANYSGSPDKISEDEVVTAINVDFAFERGAAWLRRGSRLCIKPTSNRLDVIFRHYDNGSIGLSPIYASDSAGVIRRITGGLAVPASSSIATGGMTDIFGMSAFQSFRGDCFIASGTKTLRDNGTATREWPVAAPAGTLGLTPSALSALTVTSTLTTIEGTGTTAALPMACVADASTFRLELQGTPASTNLNVNSGNTIGEHGLHFIRISFDAPENVERVSLDYSIQNSNFTTYYHAELDVLNALEGLANVDYMVEAVNETSAGDIPSLDDKSTARSVARRNGMPLKQRFTAAKNSPNTWVIPVPNFELVSGGVNLGFTNIQRLRLIIEGTAAFTATVSAWAIVGAENYPLNDPHVGYTYWETFARVESVGGVNAIVSESGPSPASARQKTDPGYRMTVVSTSSSTSTYNTHRILYRQGGFMSEPYAVATNTVATMTYTDTQSDFKALISNRRINRNVRTTLPANIRAISEEYKGRLFIAWENKIGWSLPDRPETFPLDSDTVVSYRNDTVSALIVWGDSLVIVNRDTVYELRGSTFEGDAQDWVMQRSGSKHGAFAPRATIKTPYGIFLFADDGFYLYSPGQGVEVPLTWATEKLADMFKDDSETDPMLSKGSRFVVMNQGVIGNSSAAYRDGKIYVSFPQAGETFSGRVLVLDMAAERVWAYDYPFDIRMLLADRDNNQLLAATSNGALMRLDAGTMDESSSGIRTNVLWHIRTRRWSTANDMVLQNLHLELDGGGNHRTLMIVDRTSTITIGTMNNTVPDWSTLPFNGTVANSIEFYIEGTQTATNDYIALHNMTWEMLPEPKRVRFWQTEEDDQGSPDNKRWDVHYSDVEIIESGTLTGEVIVDNVVVMTKTMAGPTLGRVIFQQAYPIETVGELAYTKYHGPLFKHWNTKNRSRPDAPLVHLWKTDEHAFPNEQFLKTWVTDIDCGAGGTATGTLFARDLTNTTIAVMTSTFTFATTRSVFNIELDMDPTTLGLTEGILMWAEYRSNIATPFKLYNMIIESAGKPFGKKQWAIIYTKMGGATRLDMGRAYSLDVEPVTGTATVTQIWDVDNIAFQTNTLTFTGRTWVDNQPFSPGFRGRLFRQRLISNVPVQVWSSGMDLERFGRKGVSIITVNGGPESGELNNTHSTTNG